jgi:hypothetical protein
LKSELRLARLTVVLSLSAPYALRQLCSADIAAAPRRCAALARWCGVDPRPALVLLPLRFGGGFGCVKFRPRARGTRPDLPTFPQQIGWQSEDWKRARSSPSTPVEVLRRVIEREGAFRDSLIFFPTLLRLYKYNTGLSLLDYKGARQQISSMSVPTPQSSWVHVC